MGKLPVGRMSGGTCVTPQNITDEYCVRSRLEQTHLGTSEIWACPSGLHCSTRTASDLASRVLASQAKPQRESESQAFSIASPNHRHLAALDVEIDANICIAGQHRMVFARAFVAFSFVFKALGGFSHHHRKKQKKKNTLFHIASNLGVRDLNRQNPKGDSKQSVVK